MNFSVLLQSKTFWLGVATIAGGVVLLVKGDAQNGITAVVSGLAMIFVRDAIGDTSAK